jgi:hypothetical protein
MVVRELEEMGVFSKMTLPSEDSKADVCNAFVLSSYDAEGEIIFHEVILF